MIDEVEYFQTVEDYFLQKRGNPMLLSPKEWSLIHEWHDALIPHEVVLRAIDRGFEKKKVAEEKAPTTLTYFKRIVKSEYKHYQKSLEGKVPETASEAKDLQEFLAQLVSALSASADQALAQGNSVLNGFLAEKRDKLNTDIALPLQQNPAMDHQRVEHLLTIIEKEIEQVLLLMISEEQMHHFKEEAMRELKMFQEKLDFPVFQEMMNRAVIKSIRKAYNIPRLSTFYM
jgi:hypothetical protein